MDYRAQCEKVMGENDRTSLRSCAGKDVFEPPKQNHSVKNCHIWAHLNYFFQQEHHDKVQRYSTDLKKIVSKSKSHKELILAYRR